MNSLCLMGTEETNPNDRLLGHRILFPSKIRKNVPLGWSVKLGYFPLKLILFQKISQSPNLEPTQEFAKTHMCLIPSFVTRTLCFTQHPKAKGGLSCKLTRHCQSCLPSSREPGKGLSCHSPLSA